MVSGDIPMAERRFHKGDHVRFTLGVRTVHGIISEERGPIGVGGRRLYGVEYRLGTEEDPSYIELPAEELQPGTPAVSSR